MLGEGKYVRLPCIFNFLQMHARSKRRVDDALSDEDTDNISRQQCKRWTEDDSAGLIAAFIIIII